MYSPTKPQFFDFDFDFGSSMNLVFPASEPSPREQIPPEPVSHQPDISRDSIGIEDPKRYTRSTWDTQRLPITPEPSVSSNDADSIITRRCVSYIERETAPSKMEDTDNQSTLTQSMTDYEAHAAKGAREQSRLSHHVGSVVDQESQSLSRPRQPDESGKGLEFKVQVIGRIMQVFLRYSLIMDIITSVY